MTNLTPEEKALLEADRRIARRRRHVTDESDATDVTPAVRGPHTPAQWDDDGWGDVPVQMRG